MTSTSDLDHTDGAADEFPEPTGFRWYLRSALPVSWLARDVMPALAYLRQTERMPVVNLQRGWLHGTHLEVSAHSDDGRAVPWPQVIARLRAPGEHTSAAYTQEAYLALAGELGRLERRPGPYLPYHPHGTFEWLARTDVRLWPGRAQVLREWALTRMLDSVAVTLTPGGAASAGDIAPLVVVAEIMLATADAHPLRIPHGTLAFESDAEAYLSLPMARPDPLPGFRQELAGDAPVLRRVVERMLAGGDTRSSASWRQSAAYCMGLFDSAALAGELAPAMLAEIRDLPAGVRPAEPPPGAFISYRLLLTLLYAQLPLLGVSARRRSYLCWAIAHTVAEVTGDSRRDR